MARRSRARRCPEHRTVVYAYENSPSSLEFIDRRAQTPHGHRGTAVDFRRWNRSTMRVPVELLERSVQLKDANQLLHAIATGSGRLVLVEGPPGIGKTAYIGAVAARAASLQLQVLRARAAELEQGFAYGVVRQLFERRLAAEPADGRSDLLAGAAGLAAP